MSTIITGAIRPLLYKTAEEIQPVIDKYFADCDMTVVDEEMDRQGNVYKRITKPYTVTDLAYALNTSRDILINWQEDGSPLSNAVSRAKEKCMGNQEVGALVGKYNAQFSIFSFKNNFGWKDKSEIEHSGGVSINDIVAGVDTKIIDGEVIDDAKIEIE